MNIKMEEGICIIQELFPNLPKDKILSHYLSLSSLEETTRLQLTIRHCFWLCEKDLIGILAAENEHYARDILKLFPNESYTNLIRKLDKYGSLRNRKIFIIKSLTEKIFNPFEVYGKMASGICFKRKSETEGMFVLNKVPRQIEHLNVDPASSTQNQSGCATNSAIEPLQTTVPRRQNVDDMAPVNYINNITTVNHIEPTTTSNQNVYYKTEQEAMQQRLINTIDEILQDPSNIPNEEPSPNQELRDFLDEFLPVNKSTNFGNVQNEIVPKNANRSSSRSSRPFDNHNDENRLPSVSANIGSLSNAVSNNPSTITSEHSTNHQINNNFIVTKAEAMNLLETPSTSSTQDKVNNKIFYTLMDMFPDAAPDYLRGLCQNVPDAEDEAIIDDLVTQILSEDYPKRPKKEPSPDPDIDIEEQFTLMKELLPDADPEYLRMKCESYLGKSDLLKQFINDAMENGNYPTIKESQKKKQLSSQQRQYTTEFSVENFLKVFPNPKATFNDRGRVTRLSEDDKFYVYRLFRNIFSKISIANIMSVLKETNYNIGASFKKLDDLTKKGMGIKSKRKECALPQLIQNIPLLQEIAYFTHKEEIKNYLKTLKESRKLEIERAKQNGLMQTCNCCYDSEVMPDEVKHCENNCAFCKSCIQKSVEVLFGEGKLDFPCLCDCGANFSLQTLQAVLPPNLFSKVAQKKALAEVKAAGIEELETCPFCDFASIPAEGDKLFHCFNPECMKDSCRSCKEPSHLPLRCDEVEKDEDLKRRHYVENKMTEALLRTCNNCGIKFYKEEGCNKMTCSCGAKMCYLCGATVKDYSHFNGPGGDKHHLCPLYTDTNEVNIGNVLKAAEEAKVEIGAHKDPSKLKVDPSADLKKHYKATPTSNPPAFVMPHRPDVAVVQIIENQINPIRPAMMVNHFHRPPIMPPRAPHQRIFARGAHHHHIYDINRGPPQQLLAAAQPRPVGRREVQRGRAAETVYPHRQQNK